MAEDPTKTYLTQKEYAAHRKTSESTVIEAVKKGRIKRSITPQNTRRINWREADADWLKNTDHSKNPNKDQHEKTSDGVPSYVDSRAIKEAYLARIKKLDFEEKNETLVNKDAILKTLQTLAFSIKEQLRTIPQKVSAELAAENDPRIIEISLMKEIDQCLESLSNLKEKL